MYPLTSDDIQTAAQEVIDVMVNGAVVLADSTERNWKTLESIGIKAGFLCKGSHGKKPSDPRCPKGPECKCKDTANHWISFHVRLFFQLVPSTSPSDPPIMHLWVSQQACQCCEIKYERPQVSGAELAKKLEYIMSRSESGTGWSTPAPRDPKKQKHFQELCELCDRHICRYTDSKSTRGNRRQSKPRPSPQNGAMIPPPQPFSPLDGNPFQTLEISE
eukprot:m.109535 g.109535  ORF g.109535 m.109535 type:complete len:218 (-) comp27965_c0_seq1:1576-2229(-)